MTGDSTAQRNHEELQSAPGVGAEGIRNFCFCIAVFFGAEIGFFILAKHCQDQPVNLNISNEHNYPDIAHIFTIVCILWQAVAAAAAEYIIIDAFSREWSTQQGEIIPGISDRVSTITSGILDRIAHSSTGRASRPFKFAFATSLLLFILIKLAPGTISAADIFVNVPIQVTVGKLVSHATGDEYKEFLTNAERVDGIIELERSQLTLRQLKLQPNLLVVYPVDEIRKLEYDSDVVEFHYSCRWEAPHFGSDSEAGLLITAGGESWSTSPALGGGINASSITPLSFTNITKAEKLSTSAFLFIGGNDAPFAIDLGPLPTAVPEGVGGSVVQKALASVLICDPHLQISGGRVGLSRDGTLRIISSGRPRIDNFPQSAANLIFSNAFQVALARFKSPSTKNLINDIGSALFMSSSPADWGNATNIPPSDIATINQKMDTFMLSAAKVFIDGQRSSSSNSYTKTSGAQEERRLVLATSPGFLYVTIVVFAFTLVLLILLCWLSYVGKGYLFNLQGVLSALEGRGMSPTNLDIPGAGESRK